MKFSLIICGYNEEENIEECIESCLALNYPKSLYEVIYVDNNSKDRSLELAKKYPIKTFIESTQGLSEARNRGIKNASGQILCFLDADLKLEKNYLIFHEQTFANSGVGAGGGKVLPLIKTWVSDYLGVSLFEGYPRFIKEKSMSTYPGCNLTIRKKVLDEVGNFKEGLVTEKGVTRFAEDKEICERIRKAGYKILYNPKSVVYHKNVFQFNDLFQIWIKGTKGRVNMIRLKKNDHFTLLFKYNLPLLSLFLLGSLIIINKDLAFLLALIYFLAFFLICIKAFRETGLIFQSFIIKPWMDLISVIVINIFTLVNRFKK